MMRSRLGRAALHRAAYTKKTPPGRSSSGGAAAFTLIELMVVIAIISMLASMLMPALSQARERARRTDCLGKISEIGKALQMYSDNFDGMMPPNNSVGGVASNRLSETGIGPTDLGRISQTGFLSWTARKIYWCRNELNYPMDGPNGVISWPDGRTICSYFKAGSNMDSVADPDLSLNVANTWDDRRNMRKALLTESKSNHGDGVNVYYCNTYSTRFIKVPKGLPDIVDDQVQFFGYLRSQHPQ